MPPPPARGFSQGRGEVSYLVTILETSVRGTDVLLAFGAPLRSTQSSAPHPGLRAWLPPPPAASSPLSPARVLCCSWSPGTCALAGPHAWNPRPLFCSMLSRRRLFRKAVPARPRHLRGPHSAALITCLFPSLSLTMPGTSLVPHKCWLKANSSL